ncbi:hypothetical protein D9619_004644 [Psilocybe cf. subviscida]|uniref:Uncharacterized protein n=1 Tax=Psilocybe cf. subviscida TaxID=2480587 RepID=A0A8H5BQQ1_9AGAR|nr:hypothetical protein D9619_004644 [Psilocybe cf. subviscida]
MHLRFKLSTTRGNTISKLIKGLIIDSSFAANMLFTKVTYISAYLAAILSASTANAAIITQTPTLACDAPISNPTIANTIPSGTHETGVSIATLEGGNVWPINLLDLAADWHPITTRTLTFDHGTAVVTHYQGSLPLPTTLGDGVHVFGITDDCAFTIPQELAGECERIENCACVSTPQDHCKPQLMPTVDENRKAGSEIIF